MIWKEKKGEE